MRTFLALIAAAGLAACATPTPFEPLNSSGYGFADQKIEENRYRISFRGNSLTKREQVETALLLRAAEITLENGYDHFIVVSDATETEREVRVSDLGPRYGAFGYYGYGAFPYYARGYPWSFYGETQVRESQRYTAIAFILLGRGAKPADQLTAYDARQVKDNLSGAVFRREQ